LRAQRIGSAISFALLIGACELHVGSGPPPAGGAPAPAPPAPPRPVADVRPPPPAPPASPAIVARFPGRIVRPTPVVNAGAAHLNVPALKLNFRANRKCGPRESTPGHWIHIDCNQYTALRLAKPFSPRKIHLLLAGLLRLDAPVQHQLPDAVDHRNDGTEGPIKDQGQVGACTALSLSSAMDNAIRRQNKPDTVSPLHIWSHYGYPDIQTAGDDNVNRSIVAWDAWPYDERVACELDKTPPDPATGAADCGPYTPAVSVGGASGDPQLQAKIRSSDSTGRWRVSEFDEIPNEPDTIAAVLATGADVWVSMNIGSTWMSPAGDTIADWTSDQVEGGHATLLAGYRHKNGQRQFLVHNSWGSDWADAGYGWISENALKQFFKNAYKVVVVDSASSSAPLTGSNALTDDDCGEGQLVDSVTGRCAPMCSDDRRPANGQCPSPAAAAKPQAAPPPKPLKLQIERH
jgi:hypothetical protein